MARAACCLLHPNGQSRQNGRGPVVESWERPCVIHWKITSVYPSLFRHRSLWPGAAGTLNRRSRSDRQGELYGMREARIGAAAILCHDQAVSGHGHHLRTHRG